MSKCFVVLMLSMVSRCLGTCPTHGTKLISTLLINRHGDRTPMEYAISMSADPTALSAAIAKYGYGQLTDVGKRRSYDLGKAIRHRYNELLSPKYNKSEIYIRSTDSSRTKMTVLIAMAGVYPSYPGSWSDVINWVPVPYTTVPAKYDFNLATLNCPKLIASNCACLNSDSPRLSKYLNVLEVISNNVGKVTTPALAYGFYDACVSQMGLGIPLSMEIACIMPELEKAAGVAIDIIWGDPRFIAYQAGVMLNEFFTQADNLIKGVDTPRMRVYSAHDSNVYAMMAAAQVTPRQGVPGYASAFALELRQVEKTGQYVVLPVYQKSPDMEPVHLSVVGCDSLPCDYNQFKKIVSEYTLDEDTWRAKCGFTNDLKVDSSMIA